MTRKPLPKVRDRYVALCKLIQDQLDDCLGLQPKMSPVEALELLVHELNHQIRRAVNCETALLRLTNVCTSGTVAVHGDQGDIDAMNSALEFAQRIIVDAEDVA